MLSDSLRNREAAKKIKNTSGEKIEQGWGDVWTWTALDPDTKLIVSYALGPRGAGTTEVFMQDVASRIVNRFQLTNQTELDAKPAWSLLGRRERVYSHHPIYLSLLPP